LDKQKGNCFALSNMNSTPAYTFCVHLSLHIFHVHVPANHLGAKTLFDKDFLHRCIDIVIFAIRCISSHAVQSYSSIGHIILKNSRYLQTHQHIITLLDQKAFYLNLIINMMMNIEYVTPLSRLQSFYDEHFGHLTSILFCCKALFYNLSFILTNYCI